MKRRRYCQSIPGDSTACDPEIDVVLTFRNGKILRYQEFYDEATALEAAGVS